MTDAQRMRLERLQQQRRPGAAKAATASTPGSTPSRRGAPRHAARRARMLALAGSLAGAAMLVSTMWVQSTGEPAAAAAAPPASAPPERIVYLVVPRPVAEDGSSSAQQSVGRATVTTPQALDPTPRSATVPPTITRSRGSH